MKIRKDGIYKTIDSKDFGLFQQSGWEKVIEEPLPKLEPIVEESIKEVEEEIIIPKSKKKKK